ncbi:MAG: hypothetical protein ACE5H7_16875 [Acidiferrobacterales bacterium]
MPYYNLSVVNEPGRILSTPAKDRVEALALFGKDLGKRLTLDDQGMTASYLLDEWHEGPHWVNPTIPVFEISS